MKIFSLFVFFLITACSQEGVLKIGQVAFDVETARTPQEQEKGLMFRESLCEKCGLLFDFGQARDVAMWMKNTPLSLDMLFIDDSKKVVFIAEQTTPYSLDLIESPFEVRYVLELNAGSVQKYHLKVGDLMQ